MMWAGCCWGGRGCGDRVRMLVWGGGGWGLDMHPKIPNTKRPNPHHPKPVPPPRPPPHGQQGGSLTHRNPPIGNKSASRGRGGGGVAAGGGGRSVRGGGVWLIQTQARGETNQHRPVHPCTYSQWPPSRSLAVAWASKSLAAANTPNSFSEAGRRRWSPRLPTVHSRVCTLESCPRAASSRPRLDAKASRWVVGAPRSVSLNFTTAHFTVL